MQKVSPCEDRPTVHRGTTDSDGGNEILFFGQLERPRLSRNNRCFDMAHEVCDIALHSADAQKFKDVAAENHEGPRLTCVL